VEQRLNDARLLFHPPRVRPDALAGVPGEVEAREQVVDPFRGRGLGEVAQPRDIGELLAPGELLEQRRLLGEVADRRDDPLAPVDRLARDPRGPRGRPGERGEHLHRGRLARAVGAEEAIDRPRGDREVERFDGGRPAVPLGETAGLDRGFGNHAARAARDREKARWAPRVVFG
jgi:hypothetical protein